MGNSTSKSNANFNIGTLDDTMNYDLNFGNFNPDDIQLDETINVVFVVDTSASVRKYSNELTQAFREFVREMRKSHVAPRLFMSRIEFGHEVKVVSGFQPINNVDPDTIDFIVDGRRTLLFKAVDKALTNALDYRENLRNSGVKTKTLVFVITDGDDNDDSKSKIDPSKIAERLSKMKDNEDDAYSFTTVLFGVGDHDGFEKAQKAMGIEHLAKVGDTGKDIRKMIGIISMSVSSVSSGSKVSF